MSQQEIEKTLAQEFLECFNPECSYRNQTEFDISFGPNSEKIHHIINNGSGLLNQINNLTQNVTMRVSELEDRMNLQGQLHQDDLIAVEKKQDGFVLELNRNYADFGDLYSFAIFKEYQGHSIFISSSELVREKHTNHGKVEYASISDILLKIDGEEYINELYAISNRNKRAPFLVGFLKDICTEYDKTSKFEKEKVKQILKENKEEEEDEKDQQEDKDDQATVYFISPDLKNRINGKFSLITDDKGFRIKCNDETKELEAFFFHDYGRLGKRYIDSLENFHEQIAFEIFHFENLNLPDKLYAVSKIIENKKLYDQRAQQFH